MIYDTTNKEEKNDKNEKIAVIEHHVVEYHYDDLKDFVEE